MPSDPWATSVNELAFIFCDALRALIPIAERLHMPWREPNNYDDWDSIATAMYRSIVVNSLEFSVEWHKFDAIPKYGLNIGSYAHSSFLTPLDKPGALAFVCFETKSEPFDTCLFELLDNDGAVLNSERRNAADTHFLLAGRSDASVVMIDSVQIRL